MNQLTIENLENVKSKWAGYRTKLRENHKTLEFEDYKTDYLMMSSVRQPFALLTNKLEMTNLFSYFSPIMLHIHQCMPLKNTFQDFQIYRTKRKTYAAMVSAVDDGVGNTRSLKNNGIKKTLS